MIKSGFFKKQLSFLFSLSFLGTQCLFAYQPENSFWGERRRASQRRSAPLLASVFQGGRPPGLDSWFTSFPTVNRVDPSISKSLGESVPESFIRHHSALLTALSPAHGAIRKVSLPNNGADPGPLVIHIQDVHMNQEAQWNIREAVRSLLQTGQVDVVALEGATEDIPLQVFVDYPQRKPVEMTADYLLKENKISGPIHAALTSQGTLPRILGVDDPSHYQANVQAYRDSAPVLEESRRKVRALQTELDRQKKGVFSPELLLFDENVKSHREGNLSLGSYVQGLLSLTQRKFVPKSVLIFNKALEMERSMDFKQVETERANLIEGLAAKLDRKETDRLLSLSLSYRSGALRYAEFYSRLKETCEKNGISLMDYPAMDAYVRYVLLADGIDAESLLKDMDGLEATAYDHLARNEEEKKLVAQSRRAWLLNKLVDFSLTPPEWEEFKAGVTDGQPFELTSFESFYEEAQSRDRAMVANVFRAIKGVSPLKTEGAPVVLLVTGGYHAEGMARQLTVQGVTVISYVPKIEKVDTAKGSSYLSVFTQEKTPLEKLFQGKKLFLAQPPVEIHTRLVLIPALIVLGTILLGIVLGNTEAIYHALGGLGTLGPITVSPGLAQASLLIGAGSISIQAVGNTSGINRVEEAPEKGDFFSWLRTIWKKIKPTVNVGSFQAISEGFKPAELKQVREEISKSSDRVGAEYIDIWGRVRDRSKEFIKKNEATFSGNGNVETSSRATSLWMTKLFEAVGAWVGGENGRLKWGQHYVDNAPRYEWTIGLAALLANLAWIGSPWVGVGGGILFLASHYVPFETWKPKTAVKLSFVKAAVMAVVYATLIAFGPLPILDVIQNPSLETWGNLLLPLWGWVTAYGVHSWFDREVNKSIMSPMMSPMRLKRGFAYFLAVVFGLNSAFATAQVAGMSPSPNGPVLVIQQTLSPVDEFSAVNKIPKELVVEFLQQNGIKNLLDCFDPTLLKGKSASFLWRIELEQLNEIGALLRLLRKYKPSELTNIVNVGIITKTTYSSDERFLLLSAWSRLVENLPKPTDLFDAKIIIKMAAWDSIGLSDERPHSNDVLRATNRVNDLAKAIAPDSLWKFSDVREVFWSNEDNPAPKILMIRKIGKYVSPAGAKKLASKFGWMYSSLLYRNLSPWVDLLNNEVKGINDFETLTLLQALLIPSKEVRFGNISAIGLGVLAKPVWPPGLHPILQFLIEESGFSEGFKKSLTAALERGSLEDREFAARWVMHLGNHKWIEEALKKTSPPSEWAERGNFLFDHFGTLGPIDDSLLTSDGNESLRSLLMRESGSSRMALFSDTHLILARKDPASELIKTFLNGGREGLLLASQDFIQSQVRAIEKGELNPLRFIANQSPSEAEKERNRFKAAAIATFALAESITSEMGPVLSNQKFAHTLRYIYIKAREDAEVRLNSGYLIGPDFLDGLQKTPRLLFSFLAHEGGHNILDGYGIEVNKGSPVTSALQEFVSDLIAINFSMKMGWGDDELLLFINSDAEKSNDLSSSAHVVARQQTMKILGALKSQGIQWDRLLKSTLKVLSDPTQREALYGPDKKAWGNFIEAVLIEYGHPVGSKREVMIRELAMLYMDEFSAPQRPLALIPEGFPWALFGGLTRGGGLATNLWMTKVFEGVGEWAGGEDGRLKWGRHYVDNAPRYEWAIGLVALLANLFWIASPWVGVWASVLFLASHFAPFEAWQPKIAVKVGFVQAATMAVVYGTLIAFGPTLLASGNLFGLMAGGGAAYGLHAWFDRGDKKLIGLPRNPKVRNILENLDQRSTSLGVEEFRAMVLQEAEFTGRQPGSISIDRGYPNASLGEGIKFFFMDTVTLQSPVNLEKLAAMVKNDKNLYVVYDREIAGLPAERVLVSPALFRSVGGDQKPLFEVALSDVRAPISEILKGRPFLVLKTPLLNLNGDGLDRDDPLIVAAKNALVLILESLRAFPSAPFHWDDIWRAFQRVAEAA